MRHTLLLLILLPALLLQQSLCGQTLAERLGYRPDEKVLIVNGDDTGMCHTANQATLECLRAGLMTSATIMVPCPWFPEIAAHSRANPGSDFGLHLVQTSEWKGYRWGPIASRDLVPGLIDPDGYLWSEAPQVYAKGSPKEALIESRAQIRKALEAGIDVTHLDSHMGVLQYQPAFLEIYRQLAVEFDLPVRMAAQADFDKAGMPQWRARFAADGILFTDDFVHDMAYPTPESVKTFWLRRLAQLKPGVTEIFIHAGHPTEELKSITGSWAVRSAEFETFTHDPEIRALLDRQGVKRIGYRVIRDLQRTLRKKPAKP